MPALHLRAGRGTASPRHPERGGRAGV